MTKHIHRVLYEVALLGSLPLIITKALLQSTQAFVDEVCVYLGTVGIKHATRAVVDLR